MTKEIEINKCECGGNLTKIYDCDFIDGGDGYKACMYVCDECLREFLGTEKVEE